MPAVATVPRFCFILQREYPLNALVLASEALRIANQNSGRQLFEWCTASMDGSDVRASNAMWLGVDHALADVPPCDYYLVFSGNLPAEADEPILLKTLKAAHRDGAVVGGIDTGGFALARAGLVGESVVVHWEAAQTFHERFARLPTSDHLFHVDNRVASCAGGVATLDLVLELVKRQYGETLATEVANALVHRPREGWQSQRVDSRDIDGSRSLSDRLLALMQRHLDFPLSAVEIAAALNVSQSTLERHCRRYFDSTPMQLYLGIRLQAARNFLFYEDYSIKSVATAYGFSSVSVFSRTFKSYFGQTPGEFRNQLRRRQARTRLPEVRRLNAADPG